MQNTQAWINYKLMESVYWVGMASEAAVTVRRKESAPLQPVIASRPWEMIAANSQRVPASHQGNEGTRLLL